MSTEADRLSEYKTRDRSFTQVSSYEQCPAAFYLERIARVWQRPAAWFATGRAVHTAVEGWEVLHVDNLNGMLSVAQTAFRADINERLAGTPNAEFWQASGPYKGPADITRRYADLRRHLENYLMIPKQPLWRQPGAELPAVEHPLDLDLDGIKVIGSIDQVRYSEDGEDLEVWDVKAGSMTPDEPLQLALYAEDLRRKTGLPVARGGYLMTAKNPTPKGRVSASQVVKKDLTTIPVESLTARFHRADEGIKAERFDPTPGDQCRRCSVLSSCPEGQAEVRG